MGALSLTTYPSQPLDLYNPTFSYATIIFKNISALYTVARLMSDTLNERRGNFTIESY